MIGQLGGFLKILQSVFRILIEPVRSYLFTLIMMKRLYFAKTEDDNVFREDNNKSSNFVEHKRSEYLDYDNIPQELQNSSFKEDIKFNRYIVLSNTDKFLLFLHFNLPCLMKISCWKKKHILTRFFKKGSRKLYEKLNVFRILSQLDDLIMME